MRRNYWLFLVILSLCVLLVPACGEEELTPVSTPVSAVTPGTTPAAALTQTPTPTAIPSGPVKIGAIAPWSGPMAMTGLLADPVIKLGGDQVKQMGGILGGREGKGGQKAD